MKTEIVYIKTEQCTQVENKKIFLKDVAEIYTQNKTLEKELKESILYTVDGHKDEKLIFSVMKIIELITKQHPGIEIENLGEVDFIVEYKIPTKENNLVELLKLIFLSAIIFFGSAFAIMTFNTDVSVHDVFERFYTLVTGSEGRGSSILEVSYCVGIPIGILTFYNHFKGNAVLDDPTPIHIEMRNYEDELNNAVIKDASREGRTLK